MTRSEIQLIIAGDLMRLFIDRQIQHYLNEARGITSRP